MPQSKLPIAALLLAALAAVVWLFWLRPEAIPSPSAIDTTTSTDQVADRPDATVVADAEGAQPEVTAPQRSAADAATTAADGALAAGKALLRITTRTAQGATVGRVTIRVRPMHGNRISPPVASGQTDANGMIEFADIAPGKVYLSTDRRDQHSTEVVAGLNEISFEVKAGVDVRGRVLDPDGRPVGGATIWLQ
ncbi:MAG: hypothetical protein KDC98_26655, partial [Planctomycetes bacterium]|nr:hypothetical protein [Planctomycetota bacterium]